MSFTSKYTGAEIEQRLDAIESNEKVTAAALTYLDVRLKTMPSPSKIDSKIDSKIASAIAEVNASHDVDISSISEEIANLSNAMVSNEKVTAAVLNDVNARITSLTDSIVSTLNSDF